jgi:hypothetical protein
VDVLEWSRADTAGARVNGAQGQVAAGSKLFLAAMRRIRLETQVELLKLADAPAQFALESRSLAG